MAVHRRRQAHGDPEGSSAELLIPAPQGARAKRPVADLEVNASVQEIGFRTVGWGAGNLLQIGCNGVDI